MNKQWEEYFTKETRYTGYPVSLLRKIRNIPDYYNFYDNIFRLEVIVEECKDNPYYFFREFKFVLNDYEGAKYLQMTPIVKDMLIYAVEGFDGYFNSPRQTGRTTIAKLIIIYNFIFHNVLPKIYCKTIGDEIALCESIDKIIINSKLHYLRRDMDEKKPFTKAYMKRKNQHDDSETEFERKIDFSFVYISDSNYFTNGSVYLEEIYNLHLNDKKKIPREKRGITTTFIMESAGKTDFDIDLFKKYGTDVHSIILNKPLYIHKYSVDDLPMFKDQFEYMKHTLSEEAYKKDVLLQ